MWKLSKKGMNLITGFERLQLESYPDLGGVWTIGYGTTKLNGYPVGPNMTISENVADALFLGSIQEYLDFMERLVKVPLRQNQIDALASLTYNIGKQGFAKSTLLSYINVNKQIEEDLFTRWNKVRMNGVLTVVDGLTRRRKAEYTLFMSKDS